MRFALLCSLATLALAAPASAHTPTDYQARQTFKAWAHTSTLYGWTVHARYEHAVKVSGSWNEDDWRCWAKVLIKHDAITVWYGQGCYQLVPA